MKTNYVLIDFENVAVKSLSLLRAEEFRVVVFLGPNNTKLPVDLVLAMQDLGNRAEYVTLETAGPNALDFHIAYYLGVLAAADPQGYFHIISHDKGFDPLIKHLKGKKIFSARSPSIEAMPCFAAPTPAAKSAPAVAAPVPAKKQKSPPAGQSAGELINVAVDDLTRRKAARPKKRTTLLATLHAACGKELPPESIQAVFDGLVDRGYVLVDGLKVSYALPNL